MPRIVFIILAAVAVVAIATVGRMMMLDGSSTVTSSGEVKVGGPFTLTDHTGKRVTEKDFQGGYMLVYFGYTFCPDVCPTSLSIIGDALGQLSADELAKVTPVFVTIDPERDTVEALAKYVPHFHENMVGLTGSLAEVRAAARAYKAYYAKVNADDPDGNYLMDHSSITYLIGPNGKYVTHFSHGTAPEKMAARLAEIL